ncbi:PKD domain-containing protein, partial [bacterium]|nr:PKD domain-containing protein [bacterium]
MNKKIFFTLVIFIFSHGYVHGQYELPAAEAGADLRVYAGDVVMLDGSASKGTELKAYWDYDDRDGVENEAEGIIAKHSYKKAGAYIATLTVEDNLGNISWDKKAVEVLTPASDGLNITDNFEGGYIGQTYKLGSTYRCHLTKSLHWTVRIDNCENKPVTLRIYGFGRNMPVPLAITHYSDETFSEKFKALYSYGFNSQEWEVLDDAEYKYIPKTETMEITAVFKKSPVYVGWSYIYTPYMLHRYLSGLPEKPFLNIEYIGKTVQGREIPMVTIGEPGLKKDKTVWLFGGQHGFEVGGISS